MSCYIGIKLPTLTQQHKLKAPTKKNTTTTTKNYSSKNQEKKPKISYFYLNKKNIKFLKSKSITLGVMPKFYVVVFLNFNLALK
jgi:hypothetical protein